MTRKILLAVQIVALIVVVGLVAWLVASRFGKVAPPPVIAKAAESMLPKHKPTERNRKAYLAKDDPSVKIEDIGPRKWKIIDVHEHAKGEEEAKLLIQAMDKLGVQRVALQASTIYTLTLNPKYGFEGFKENNESLLAVEKKWPDRFATFVTINPADEGNLELVKDYVSRGADGVKLYIGHGANVGTGEPFHIMPLNDPRMEPFWTYVEEIQLPVTCHINLNKFWDETIAVLEAHPYLRMNIPHLGLHKNSGERLARLSWMLTRYPNLYSDVSFGFHTFQIEGFEALGKYKTRSRDFMIKHRDKLLYASDMVLEPTKDEPYIINTLRSYMQFLEMDKWRFFLAPDFTMHGMGLDDETLSYIYEKAPAKYLNLDEKGNLPDRERGVVPKTERPPLPPYDPLAVPVLPASQRDKSAKPSTWDSKPKKDDDHKEDD